MTNEIPIEKIDETLPDGTHVTGWRVGSHECDWEPDLSGVDNVWRCSVCLRLDFRIAVTPAHIDHANRFAPIIREMFEDNEYALFADLDAPPEPRRRPSLADRLRLILRRLT